MQSFSEFRRTTFSDKIVLETDPRVQGVRGKCHPWSSPSEWGTFFVVLSYRLGTCCRQSLRNLAPLVLPLCTTGSNLFQSVEGRNVSPFSDGTASVGTHSRESLPSYRGIIPVDNRTTRTLPSFVTLFASSTFISRSGHSVDWLSGTGLNLARKTVIHSARGIVLSQPQASTPPPSDLRDSQATLFSGPPNRRPYARLRKDYASGSSQGLTG